MLPSGTPSFPRAVSKAVLAAVRQLVLPDRCLACGQYMQTGTSPQGLSECFCARCLDVTLFSRPFCSCCGHLFEAADRENHLCERCLKRQPAFGRVRASFAYEGVIRTAVALLKYKGKLKLARPLEFHLYQAFERFFIDCGIDLVLPIPLHRARVWKRGFNQAAVLVRHFPDLYARCHGRKPAWTVELKALVRRRYTESQTGMDQVRRKKNLENAFGVVSDAGIVGRHILLVDDVFTSGATCRSAARVLIGAGARQVDVLVLARA